MKSEWLDDVEIKRREAELLSQVGPNKLKSGPLSLVSQDEMKDVFWEPHDILMETYMALFERGLLTLEEPGQFEQAIMQIEKGRNPHDVLLELRRGESITEIVGNGDSDDQLLKTMMGTQHNHRRSSVNPRYDPGRVSYDWAPSPRRRQVHAGHNFVGNLETNVQTPVNWDSDPILQHATGKGTTNSVLDVVGFNAIEQNFLFNVYGKGIVRSAISIYFRANPNEHQRKVREQETSTDYRHGLVATMELLRKSKRSTRYHNVQNQVLEGDILLNVQNRYRDKSPVMRVKDPVQMGVMGRLNYLVRTYIHGENLDIPNSQIYVAAQSPLTAHFPMTNGNIR